MKHTQMIDLEAYTMEMIPSNLLIVPRDLYQKRLNKKRVAQIVADFDDAVANELKVSFRDGKYYVFDGQHTLMALIKMNDGKPLLVRCKVYRGLTVEQEAVLFATQTGHAALPTAAERLHALTIAHDEEALAFTDASESSGLLLAKDGLRGDGYIKCINTAWRMYRRLGDKRYREAIGVIYDAWEGKADSLRGEIILAVCEFVRLYHGKYNLVTLTTMLSQTNPRQLCSMILSDIDRPGYGGYVYPIFALYNEYCGPQKLKVLF